MNGINEWMMQANEQQCLNELLAQPEEEADLTLTGAQALQLLETRREALHREGLAEWGEGILPQLAKRFEQSAYLDRQTYAESLERLAALFYHCRAQAGERVTDEQILEFLSTRFEGICGGDFERLEELAQEFLQLFPEPLAVRTLLRFDPDYRRQFYNLSGVLLRCVMVTALRQEILGDRTAPSAACLAVWRTTTTPAQQEAKLALLLQQMTAGRCPHSKAMCRYLAPELHGFVQQLAVTSEEGLGHLAVCMEQ